MTMADFEVKRYIEGVDADFQAGCELSALDLNPNICLKRNMCMKSDATTVLISRRPGIANEIGLAELKAMLLSVGGPLRLYHPPPLSVRARWYLTTVAGFYQPEHAHRVVKYFRGSSDIEALLMYTVYFTAPKEISDAIFLDVDETVSTVPELQISWGEPKQGQVTLQLSGTEREKFVSMKIYLEAVFNGDIATDVTKAVRNEIWHPFFATPSGKNWLQHLGRDHGVIITSDSFQQRIFIHQTSDHIDRDRMYRMQQKLVDQVVELGSRQESHHIPLTTAEFRNLIASGTVAKMQKALGSTSVSLDILKKTLVLHCSRQTARSITQDFHLPLPTSAAEVSLECPQCSETTIDIEFSNCGHVVCSDCFMHQISVASTDLTSSQFPLVCWHDSCKTPIALKDLRKYCSGALLDALMKTSLTYHIRSFPAVYRNCRTPDCKSVYNRLGSYETFTCPTCLAQTCTKCHEEPHIGWTCAEFETHLNKTRSNERLLEDYKAEAGTKECPKCATLIEKVDGCNHVECSGCHGHLCWVCLKVFGKSESVYDHMNSLHGGNGLVGGEFEEEVDDNEDEDEGDWSDQEDGEERWARYLDQDQHLFW